MNHARALLLAALLLPLIPNANASTGGEGIEQLMPFPSLPAVGVAAVATTTINGTNYIVSAQQDGRTGAGYGLALWSIAASNTLTFHTNVSPTNSTPSSTAGTLAFNTDGATLAYCRGTGNQKVHLYTVGAGSLTEAFVPQGNQYECDENDARNAISWDGDYLIFGNDTSPYIHARQFTGGSFTGNARTFSPAIANFSSSGGSFAATEDKIAVRIDTNLSIYESNGTAYVWTTGATASGTGEGDLAWNLDGTILAVGSGNQGGNSLQLYSHTSGGLSIIDTSSDEVAIEFAPDGTMGFTQGSGCTAPCSFDLGTSSYADISRTERQANLTGIASQDSAFTSDDEYLIVALATTPYMSAFQRSDARILRDRNGPTSDNPGGVVNEARSSITGGFTAFAHATSPFVSIFDTSPRPYVKLANPASLPASTGNGVGWGNDDQFLAVAHANTPFVTIYERSGTTFTKLTNPASLPAGTGNGAAFSPGATHLAIAHATTPFITVYSRSGTTFTKLTNPASLPASTGNAVAWSPNGTMLAVGGSGTPSLAFYYLSGSTLIQQTAPSVPPNGTVNALDWNADGTLLVGHSTSPFVSTYTFTGGVFVKSADIPTSLNALSRTNVAWNPEGTGFAATATASGGVPSMNLYDWNKNTLTATRATTYEIPNAGSSSISWFAGLNETSSRIVATKDTATAFWYNTTFGTRTPATVATAIVGCDGAAINWTEATSPPGTVTSYVINRSSSLGYNRTYTIPPDGNFTLRILNDTPPQASTTFHYTIVARNSTGAYGVTSNIADLTFPTIYTVGDCGLQWGGMSEADIAEAAHLTTDGLELFLSIILVLVGTGIGAAATRRGWGAASGAACGILGSIALGYIPIWAIFLLILLIIAGFILARSGGRTRR